MAKRALCIGINDYPGTQNDLRGCVNDANDWATALAARGFTVSKLLDSQATKAALVAGFEQLITSAKSGDTIAITFSGHGTLAPRADLKCYPVDGSGLRRAISSIAVMSWDTLCIPERMEANPPKRNRFNATVRRHPITPAPLPR